MLKFRFGTKDGYNSCYGQNAYGEKTEWNDPERIELKESIVQAPSIEDALEHFCSTNIEPELHIGRLVRRNPQPTIVPEGYNLAGKKVDFKPSLPGTKDISDNKIIQVWQEREDDPDYEDWFYGKFEDAHVRTGYAYSLVFELPLVDLQKYDKWGNVDHYALPAPASGTLGTGTTELADLSTFKAKPIRTFNRGQIAIAKRAMMAKKLELEGMMRAMEAGINKLNTELEFRGQQLRYLTLYLGRNVETVLINKGPKADDTDLVHIRQRVLYMAEEVGALEWNTEVGFDFRNIGDFDNWVVKPENLYIIAPEPKCIVFMKPRRSDANYGNPMLDYFLNKENRKVYVLFRNGMTVYRAQLDIAIPDRLFPEEEKFEQDLEHQRESNIGYFWDSNWNWKKYEEQWKARERWYAKGFTDADFSAAIKYKTEEEMLAAKAQAKAEYEAKKANPKETVSISEWDIQNLYERYQKELKEFFYGLAFIQGIFDRTDIFGNLKDKVNVFTGLGLGQSGNEYAKGPQYAKLIYDLSESRTLVDKKTPSLVAWLRSEAAKVKVGDYVVIRAEKDRGYNKNPTRIRGIAQVVKVKSPGMIQARMPRETWRYDYDWRRDPDAAKHGVVHKLMNRERSPDDTWGDQVSDIQFYPWNLPMDGLKFYVERRADRDKYWDNLLVDLLRLKTKILKKEKPEVSPISAENRIDSWPNR